MKFRSALVRLLDRRYPTNLAVLILAPASGLVFAGLALSQGVPGLAVLETALRGGMTAFGGWALAREIAPDDNPAAFVSMGLALLLAYLVPPASILVLFTAMMLARLVNRSVGMPATLLDSVAITLLAGWAAYTTRSWAPLVVGAIAFGLDAMLPSPLRRQWIFVPICLAGALAVTLFRDGTAAAAIDASLYLPVVTIAFLYALALLRTRHVRSVADITGERLIAARVRAGMAIAWLMAVQGSLVGESALAQSSLIWAGLAAVLIMLLFHPAGSPGNSSSGN